MSLIATELEWHDLRIDAGDLPGEREPVLVTLETFNGDRIVWDNVYFKFGEDSYPIWCTTAVTEQGLPQETMVWYPVIAWAYLPEPYYM